jgi:hypothetical protein
LWWRGRQPIKDGSGAVTHYVGIQQDVTLLTEMGSDPRQWTPPEVGMWLDHVDLGDYSLKAVQQDIVGTDLFAEVHHRCHHRRVCPFFLLTMVVTCRIPASWRRSWA